MTTAIDGTTGVIFPNASIQNTAATGYGFEFKTNPVDSIKAAKK